MFGPAIFLSSILNFILPVMTTNFGIPAIMAIRVIQGMVQGPETPALYTISARWLPAPEKNRMLSFILSGKFDVNKKFFSGHFDYDLCNCRTSSRAHTKYVILWVDYQFIRMGGTILPH